MKTGILSLGKDTIIYGLGDALYKAVAFFLLPVYLKYLSPVEYGTIESLMVTRGLVVTFVFMGLPNAVFRFYYRTKDEQERKSIVSTIFFISLGLQIVIAGLFFLKSDWLSTMVLSSPEFAFFFAILAANVFLISFRGIPFAIFRAKKRAIAYSITNLTVGIVTLLMNILFVAYLEKGVLGVLYGNLCGALVGFIIVIPALFKDVNFSFNIHFVRRILSFSVPLGLAVIPVTIIFMADRYFIIRLTSLHDLGIYALAYKFGSILKAFVIMPFMLAWGPFVFSKESEDNAKDIYAEATRYFVIITLSFVVLISILQIDIVKILTKSSEYQVATKVIPVICYSFFFYGLSKIVAGVGIRISGKTYYTTGIMLTGMCVNIAGNYILINSFGFFGAAYSLLSTFIVVFFLSYISSVRLYRVNYEVANIFKIVSFSAIIVAFSQVLSSHAFNYGFVIRISLVFFYFFCIYYMELSTYERTRIRLLFFEKVRLVRGMSATRRDRD